MRFSQYFLFTQKEVPADAAITSHRLMLRANLISQITSGIYAWLPLGERVIKKVEKIIEEEQNKLNAQRITMPTIQPLDLWKKSGRSNNYGKELLKIIDRHEKELVYGPTHEEVIVTIFNQFVKSYKSLPMTLYQIHWKFRDEIRPRFGVMRAREFLMKDAYSFSLTEECAIHVYGEQFKTYIKTFSRMGLRAIPVRADSGAIGGSFSHEFQIMANSGESTLYYDSAYDDISPNDLTLENLDKIYTASDEQHNPEKCPVPENKLKTARGIEVGHIFVLGDRYTKSMDAFITNKEGKKTYPYMGCYGMGVSRIVGAIIEANHDEKGIIWPLSVAPFQVIILNLKTKNELAIKMAESVYSSLQNAGIEALYDDRDVSSGVKFNDADLIGIPYQIIISQDSENLEIKTRSTGEKEFMSIDEFISRIMNKKN